MQISMICTVFTTRFLFFWTIFFVHKVHILILLILNQSYDEFYKILKKNT
jgi:hypothetical protein